MNDFSEMLTCARSCRKYTEELSQIEGVLIGNPDIVFVGSDAETIFEKPCSISDSSKGTSNTKSSLSEKISLSIKEVDLSPDTKELLETMSSVVNKNEDLPTVAALTFRECLEGHIEDKMAMKKDASYLIDSLD